MTSQYTDIQISPTLKEWGSQLRLSELDNARLMDARRSARRRLVAAAQKYILRLHAISDEADLPENTAALLTGDVEERPIVMTGHQPVVFHSGLTFKYDVTQRFAADSKAICVGVIIDTDRGDAGQFSYPEADTQIDRVIPRLAIDSVAESHTLYSKNKLKSAGELKGVFDNLIKHLGLLNRPQAAAAVVAPFKNLSQLRSSTSSAMEANLITRWLSGVGNRMLELPLSAIASFPESLMLTADILKQPLRFAAAYNSALDVFREENGIRNVANPFPNLKTEADRCELPFWIINHESGTRQVLEVHLDGNVTRLLAGDTTVDTFTGNITPETLEPMLLQNLQIVPRGALITAFLRLLFSDLFVHGTGGARYDNFTDEFIRSWWGVEPSPFTVASASRYLFVEQRNELRRLEDLQESLRDLQFNPQRHFGNNVFSSAAEKTLRDLTLQKDTALEDLKTIRADGGSAREVGAEIQRLTAEIKAAVNGEFAQQQGELSQLAPEQIDAINCRTYPWFLFES